MRGSVDDVAAPPRTPSLSPVVAVASTQLDLLLEAAARGADAAGLRASALDLVLRALRAEAEHAATTAPADERAALAAFVDKVGRYERATVQLSQHLVEMTADWTCGKCGADVARGVAVSSVETGAALVRVDVECAACGARSKIAPQGRKVFEQRFGHLVRADWNPTANGFVRGDR